MAQSKVHSVHIDAIYSSIPEHIVYTKDYEFFSETEAQIFSKNTGIVQRRVADSNVTCSDLCTHAATELLKDTDAAADIDLLVFVSQSPDYFLPATAAILQNRLSLSKQCMAFDVNLGCSGYVYGLQIVGNFLQTGQYKKALLLVGDKSTISTNINDKSTYPLFGDAGTATLLSYREAAPSWFFDSGTDGSGKDAIIIPAGHSRMPYNETFSEVADEFKYLKLDGLAVFNFALSVVPQTIRNTLIHAEKTISELDFLVLHQANGLITKSIAAKLGIDRSKCLESIAEYGNTSSASIPLSLCVHNFQVNSEVKKMVFCGFGVGFSWSTVYLESSGFSTKLLTYSQNER